MLLSTKRNYGAGLFDDFFNDPFFSAPAEKPGALMRTDIQDAGNSYLLEIELPGYKKENVRAELKNGYLTVFAENSGSAEESEAGYIRRERFCGSCKRSFYVGTDLKQEDIKASFENGILKLSVPKEAPKQVEESHYIAID